MAPARFPIHRSPISVSAQVTPESAASRLPRGGSGAVADGASAPTKNSTSPSATGAMKARSRPRVRSFSSSGARSRRYIGAVDCRKIALAEVVSLLEATNSTRVAA